MNNQNNNNNNAISRIETIWRSLITRFSDLLTLSLKCTIAALILILIAPYISRIDISAKERETIDVDIAGSEIMLQIGEELQYKVSYSIFTIGSVKFQVLDTAVRNGVKVIKARAIIESAGGLPFVNVHELFYSEMGQDLYSQFFSGHNTTKLEAMPMVKYFFDYKNNKVTYQYGIDPNTVVTGTKDEQIFEPQLDGLSLFYYARKNFRQVKQYPVAVCVGEKSFTTHFNFMNKIGSKEIDAVKYSIETIEFDGNSEFTGVFGLTGYFKGYFSNDEAGIPIVAEMKVIIGSVCMELIQWNRPGWVPPKAKE